MEKINTTEITEALQQRFGTEIIEAGMQYDILTVEVSKTSAHNVLQFLKEHPVFQFNFLTTLCGLHFPDAPADKQMGIMYQLHSFTNNIRIRIKAFFPDAAVIEIPTITDLWSAANWQERQEYDFFGFNFTGHPNLRRILNMDEMTMFPMRKEYPLEDQTREDKDDTMFGR